MKSRTKFLDHTWFALGNEPHGGSSSPFQKLIRWTVDTTKTLWEVQDRSAQSLELEHFQTQQTLENVYSVPICLQALSDVMDNTLSNLDTETRDLVFQRTKLDVTAAIAETSTWVAQFKNDASKTAFMDPIQAQRAITWSARVTILFALTARYRAIFSALPATEREQAYQNQILETLNRN